MEPWFLVGGLGVSPKPKTYWVGGWVGKQTLAFCNPFGTKPDVAKVRRRRDLAKES